MICPNCGGNIRDDSKFCAQCSFPLKDVRTGSNAKKGKSGKKTGLIIAVAAGAVVVLVLAAFFVFNKWFQQNVFHSTPAAQPTATFEDEYTAKASSVIKSYLEDVKYLSENQFPGMDEALQKLYENLTTQSSVRNFWFDNATLLTGYRGSSIVGSIEMTGITIKGETSEDRMTVESQEKWVLTQEVHTFNFTYNLHKDSSGNWLIDDMACNGLTDALELAGDRSMPDSEPSTQSESSGSEDLPSQGAPLYNKWDSVTASSALPSDSVDSYFPQFVLDENRNTAWVEGADGDGIGEWIMLQSNTPQSVGAIFITNGFTKSQDIYYKNNRVKKVKIEFSDGSSFTQELYDDYATDTPISFKTPVSTRSVKITILEVYKGSKYQDTCISGIITCE